MKKIKIKAFLCAALCAVSAMSITVSAENYNVTPTPNYIDDTGIAPQATDKPYLTWDLSSDGRYDFSGSSSDGQPLYTNKMFTGVVQYHLYVENKRNTTLTVTVYKDRAFLPDTVVDTYTIPANDTKEFDRGNWDSSEKYYLDFGTNCKFKGYIEKLSVK